MDGRSDEMVGYLVWRLSTTWRTEVDRVVAPLGMTHAQYSLLASLYGMSGSDRERPSQRELADWTGLEAIYVSKLSRSLERAGLLTRSTNPRDPRAVQLELTELGTKRVGEAITRVQALIDELTAPIGGVHSERNREFVRTLNALLDNKNKGESQ